MATVRTRIRRDRAQAPKALRKVFTVVAARFSQPSLNATKAWKLAGLKDRSLKADFKAFTKVTLRQYIEARRIDMADLLIEHTYINLYSIGVRVGYPYYPTFIKAYRRQKNEPPTAVVRKHQPPPLIDDLTSLKAGRGMLTEDEYLRYFQDLSRLYPNLIRVIPPGVPRDPS